MFLSATVFHTNKHFLHLLSSISRCTLDTLNKQIKLYVTHKSSPQVYTFLNHLLSVMQTFKKFSMNKCQIPSKRLNKSYSYKVYNSLSGSFCVRFSEESKKAGRWPLTKILCDQSHCQKLIREFFKGVTRRCRLSLCPIFKLSGKNGKCNLHIDNSERLTRL